MNNSKQNAKFNGRKHNQAPEEPLTEDECCVCFSKAEYYSVGECNHPVCFACSTRMRVLLGQSECPICRMELSNVVFLEPEALDLYVNLETRKMSFEARYKIYFSNRTCMNAYDRLLDHSCVHCDGPCEPVFRTFLKLREHLSSEHQLYYCDLCVDHHKLFSKHRRTYTREQLALHRRKGDPDDKSHRGHPLCQFCDMRYLDNDELYKHLRKDHFFCHFCDADGKEEFYMDYASLMGHFKENHHLCVEGRCKDEMFTHAFRHKIDFQAHVLERHAETKDAIRQARTLDLHFCAPQRDVREDQRRQYHNRPPAHDPPPPCLPPPPPPPTAVDIKCRQDFPRLGGGFASAASNSSGGGGSKYRNVAGMAAHKGGRHNMEAFPALGGGAAARAKEAAAASAIARAGSPSTTNGNGKGGKGNGNTKVDVRLTGNPSATPWSNPGQPKKKPKNAPKPPQGEANNFPALRTPMGVDTAPSVATGGTAYIKQTAPAKEKVGRKNANGQKTANGIANKENNGGGGNKPAKNINQNVASGSNSAKSTKSKKNDKMEDFPSLKKLAISDQNGNAEAFPSLKNSAVSENTSKNHTQNKAKTKPKKLNPKDFPSLAVDPSASHPMKNFMGNGNGSKQLPTNSTWGKGSDGTSKATTGAKPAAPEPSKPKKEPKPVAEQPFKKPAPVAKNKRSARDTKLIEEDEIDTFAAIDTYGRLPQESMFTSMASETSSNIKTYKAEVKVKTANAEPAPSMAKTNFPTLGGMSLSKKGTAVSWGAHLNEPAAVVEPEKSVALPQKSAQPLPRGKKGKKQVVYAFVEPPNFARRNVALLATLKEACYGDDEKLNQFGVLAGHLRGGSLEGGEFYAQCRVLIGPVGIGRILQELLVLLPDVTKQQALLQGFKKSNDVKKLSRHVNVTECGVCGQVSTIEDHPHHNSTHNHFPKL